MSGVHAKGAREDAEERRHAGNGMNGAAGADQHVAAEFARAVAAGADWFPTLLRAIANWTTALEVRDGRRYAYLVAGEAFDWLLLAERLLPEAGDRIPEDDKIPLLFRSELPSGMSTSEFRELIGALKYRAHLNYVYGILVEEALQQAVLEETSKAHQNMATREAALEIESFQRLYGATPIDLLTEFRAASGRPISEESSLEEQREFTYWLFKRRLAKSDPARLASDTRKGLLFLARHHPGAWRWVQSEALEA